MKHDGDTEQFSSVKEGQVEEAKGVCSVEFY